MGVVEVGRPEVQSVGTLLVGFRLSEVLRLVDEDSEDEKTRRGEIGTGREGGRWSEFGDRISKVSVKSSRF